MKRKNILLLAGDDLSKKYSFNYTIKTLAKAFIKGGNKVFLSAPIVSNKHDIPEDSIFLKWDAVQSVELFLETINAMVCDAVICHGHLDMFPKFVGIKDAKAPVFFWAQYSSPKIFLKNYVAKNFYFAPLTEMTMKYILLSGCENVTQPIPHFVNDIYFRRDISQLNNKEYITIGSVGVNTVRKRLDALIRLLAKLLDNKIKTKLVLKTTAKPIDDGLDLYRYACKLGVANHLHIIENNLSEQDMFDLYSQMDIYIQTSEWEGFGIPVAEAMACGIPTVVHNVQGCGEIVPFDFLKVNSIDKKDGNLLQIDENKLLEMVISLAEDQRKRFIYGKMLRDCAIVKYSESNAIKLWLKTFDDYGE